MKFYGNIGYGLQTETAPDVWDDLITERTYFGDVERPARRLAEGTEINNDLSVTNQISIVADGFANDNIMNMKYVVYLGTRWIVSNVTVQRPRLLISLGGVYRGPTP